MRRAGWLLAIAALAGSDAAATEVRVEIRSAGDLVAGVVTAERQRDGYDLEAEAAAGWAVLDLDSGEWAITAAAPGFWSPRQRVDASQTGQLLTFLVWPSGKLSGQVRGAGAVELEPAPSLDLTFQPSPDEARKVPSGSVSCPVVEGRLICELPAGRLDLHFASEGFIHRYFWDVLIRAGELSEIGPVVLMRGSSVRGWVVAEDRGSVAGTVVELNPRIAADPGGRNTERIASRQLSARATDRGFFQINGMGAGAYVATATLDNYSPARASVRILDGQATEINNPPLTLRRSREIAIYVDPPSPPIGRAWMGELVQIDSHGNPLDDLSSEIPVGGAWIVEGIADGTYGLKMRTTEDRETPGAGVPAWHYERVEIGPDSSQIFVTISAVAVSGTLRLGKDPLSGRVIFGGKHGAIRRTFLVDNEGHFSGWLPRSGRWRIDVAAEEPPVQARIERDLAADGEEVEIVIPDTRIVGEVVFATGKPNPGTLVRIIHTESSPQQRVTVSSDESGRFEAHGIPPGSVTLRADAFQLTSDPQQIALQEGVKPPWVRLVLRRVVQRVGQVIDRSSGLGVPGAEIIPLVVEDPTRSGALIGTDEDGRFSLQLPPMAQNLVLMVNAPGFALTTLRIPLSKEGPLLVPVGVESGTLRLVLPETYSQDSREGFFVVVLHDGGYLSVDNLQRWASAGGRTADSGSRVDPGDYSACWISMAEYPAALIGNTAGLQCVSGTLPGSGELTLTVPARLGNS